MRDLKGSIFKKLMLTHLIVILLSIAVLGVLMSQLMKNYFLNTKEDELAQKGAEIGRITAQYLKKQMDETTTSFLIDSLDRFIGARVWIVDKNGLLRMASRNGYCGPRQMMMQRGVKLDSNVVGVVLKGQVSKQVGTTPYFSEQMVSVGVPIFDQASGGKNVIGAVLLNAPVTGVSETLQKVYLYLFLAILMAVILAGLLAVYLSRELSKPLHEIASAALAMAKGDYQKRVRHEGDDEIGELAASFNYMGDKLSNTIDALHQEKSKIESLMISLNEGVIATDKDGVVVWVNPMAKQLMGFAGDPVGSNPSSCCNDIAAITKKVIDTGNLHTSTFQKDNTVIKAVASPIIDSKGGISGTVCVLLDISEAEKLEQMRKDFVSDVSHELRTPLTAIRGYNEALADGTAEEQETRQKYHGIIREETERLERLVHDLLDLSRLQSGKISVEMVPLDLGAIIKSTVEKMRPSVSAKGINLDLSVEENLPYIIGNEDRLVQLIIILLDNASRYTKPLGEVAVNVAGKDNGVIEVAVKDTGPGVPKEDIPFLFERFYKVDKSRTRTGAGMGLGLAIAKQIVEMHQGSIDVSSELGQGTVFSISFRHNQKS